MGQEKLLIIGIVILTTLFDIIVATVAFRQKDKGGNRLGICMSFTAIATVAYTVYSMSESYFMASVAGSIHFASITCMLYAITRYIQIFTATDGEDGGVQFRRLNMIFHIWCIIDVCILAVNPFYEISVGYKRLNGESIANWALKPEILYDMHLVLSYLMLAFVIIRLFERLFRDSTMLRPRYQLDIWGIMLVVALNAAYLFVEDTNSFDYSVLFYSIIGFVIYWNGFFYEKRAIRNYSSHIILYQLGNPIVIFDENDHYIFSNESAASLFDSNRQKNRSFTIQDMEEELGLSGLDGSYDAENVFQWVDRREAFTQKVFRCDFRMIQNKKGKVIGKVFIFTDNSIGTDLLTGFHNIASLRNDISEIEHTFEYPLGVTVCDLNRLSEINEEYGRTTGDDAIMALADSMRRHFPKNTYFVRMNEANLLAICNRATDFMVQETVNAIKEELSAFEHTKAPLEMQSAAVIVESQELDIVKAADKVIATLKVKKMMDHSSAHHSLLDSLTQTLQESDNCTEQHVLRTRMLGEQLGKRLGLTDIELSDLQLLCILHDIGKLGIPLDILNKPGRLSKEEWEVMRSHVEKGYRIAKASNELESIAVYILHHHEAWNGGGYPDGLKQEAIPLLSRIIAVVDTFDAMVNDRPYRKAISVSEAKKELIRCAGTQFDPYITSVFLDMVNEMYPEDEEEFQGRNEEQRPMGIEEIESSQLSEKDDTLKPLRYALYYLDDDNDTILSVNEEFTNLTGYSQEDIKSYHLKQSDLIFSENHNLYSYMVSQQIQQHNEAFIEHRIRRKDGSERLAICYGSVFFDPVDKKRHSKIIAVDAANTNAVRLFVAREKESARRTQERLLEESRLDSLTGLLNHTAFQNDTQLRIMDKSINTIYMVMMDVDRFKEYNDSKGHAKGDELLITFATCLKHIISNQGFAGRLGGDEFAIVYYGEGEENQTKIKEEFDVLHKKITGIIQSYDKDVTISMGVAMTQSNLELFTDLYKRADSALYESKENGRNQASVKFGE